MPNHSDAHDTPRVEQWHSEHGATAAEYAILAALIAMAIFVTVGLLGVSISDIYENPTLMDAVT